MNDLMAAIESHLTGDLGYKVGPIRKSTLARDGEVWESLEVTIRDKKYKVTVKEIPIHE